MQVLCISEVIYKTFTLLQKYVPGHKGVDGNEEADRLANEGAMKVAAKSGKSWFW